MPEIFIQISIVIFIVLLVSFIMKILKQPLIIGYILSGIIIGPLLLNFLPDDKTLTIFSEMGIAFLLFIVGLHLSPKVIREVGKIALITGIGQVVFTVSIGYFIARLLGFTSIASWYLAIAISFSSTIIIMKLLSDKDALEKLYGKISIGFLLVQDFIAITLLLIISSSSAGENIFNTAVFTFLKGLLIFVILVPFTYYVLPKLSMFFAKSQELLFIFAISWGLGFAALFNYLGFSLEVGALIAGIVLSLTPYSFEVSSKLRPLRDFFIISFFILLGAQMVFQEVITMMWPAIIFSLVILFGNPLIVMTLMGIFKYTRHTGFMCGLTVAQISEFSLIIIALGARLGHIDSNIISLITVVALTTIAGSTYMIMFSDKIYPKISRLLGIFERKNIKEKKIKTENYPYILIGENRIGFSIMNAFNKLNKKFLVIDYNPDVAKRLSSENIACLYGDVSNIDFLEEIRLDKSKLIVSTIPDRETNLLLLDVIRRKNRSVIIILAARQISDAFEFYEAGADYVILPHFLGGEYVARIIEGAKESKPLYKRVRQKHMKELNKRLMRGHEHPHIEKDHSLKFKKKYK